MSLSLGTVPFFTNFVVSCSNIVCIYDTSTAGSRSDGAGCVGVELAFGWDDSNDHASFAIMDPGASFAKVLPPLCHSLFFLLIYGNLSKLALWQ